EAEQRLKERTSCLKLIVSKGEKHSAKEEKINNVTYKMAENPMEITEMRFTFDGERGCLCYANAQGYKELFFGLGYNEFGLFPEEGYSDEVASVYAPGNYYKCAASGAWLDEATLHIIVQIIDTYLGSLHITVNFGEKDISVDMFKDAEDYMNEYDGSAYGQA
ncbi:MAG: hypothetical protein IKV54_01000, partial [Clostridia bacterium]|nr:hypothetical protein [Clostridia bacterium]